MKVDITSMFFNSRIEGGSATAPWSTSIGQSQKRDCRIDDFKPEVVDMVIGMAYKSISDLSNLDASKGSSNREILISSVFDKVFITGEGVKNKRIENTQYTLLLVREHSEKHEGRLLISFAPYIIYNGISNEQCIDLMRQQLGCSENGCWFVYDISIINQDELHFSAVAVNPTSQSVYKNSKERTENWRSLVPNNEEQIPPQEKPIQRIIFGAPGTGKSYTVKERYEKNLPDNFVFRTTFHPDMDYSMFVGCYKPKTQKRYLLEGKKLSQHELLQIFKDSATYTNEKKARYLFEGLVNAVDIKKMGLNGQNISDLLKADGFASGTYTIELDNMIKAHDWLESEGYLSESNISYEFVSQTFTDAYVAAWKDLENKYYLIIEEINRGNCAQIFGDLFQLLDRDKKTGRSSYRIKADNDLRDYLKEQLPEGNYGIADDKLCLPPNLNIIATMNTSDQSLFPMDSAFKRRWEWEYVPIQYEKEFTLDGETKTNRSYNFIIKIDDNNQYRWIEFLKQVNKKIKDLTVSEDKQMGNYFVDLPNGKTEIDEKTFKNKVMFYLWNDICKDEVGNQNNFYRTKENEFSFNELFGADGQKLLIGFLDNIEGIKTTTSTPAGATPPATPPGDTPSTSTLSGDGDTPNEDDEPEQ